ncbi:hypothetical protein FB451DRAFT_1571420 [Mycena latifolia]|nr:hypothetical protein FB451DRAFT_1571420 [Mycena latifolia]
MQEGCRQWLPLEALQASNANPTASASSSTGAPKSSVMPHSLTQPRPPVATRTRRRRAPPVSTAGVGPARVLSCSALGKTSASGSATAAAAVATPDVITHPHKHLPAPGSAHSQDAERLTALLQSKVASSSISASAAVEADLLVAQRQLAGATAQLVNAQAKKVELDDRVRFLFSLSAPLPPARPPVRSPVRLAPASFRAPHGASFARTPRCTAGHLPTRPSPLAFLLLQTPTAYGVLRTTPNTSPAPGLSLPARLCLRVRSEIAPWRVHTNAGRAALFVIPRRVAHSA